MNDAPEEVEHGQGRASRDWCFTLNNPTADDITFLSSYLQTPAVRYAVYQPEVGDSGTHHFQGFIQFRSPRRLATLHRLLPRAHFENRRGSPQQARQYCIDEAKRVPGTTPTEFGQFDPGPGQGQRQDILKVCAYLKTHPYREAVLEYPYECAKFYRFFKEYRNMVTPPRTWVTKVYVFIGPTGTGKTRTAHHLFPQLWTKPPGPWYDTYDAHEVILLDDFDGSDITFTFLLRLLDRYHLLSPVKGSYANWAPKHVIITSNYPIDEWYNRGDPERNAPLHRRISRVCQFPLSPLDRRFLSTLGPLPPDDSLLRRDPPSPLDDVLMRN